MNDKKDEDLGLSEDTGLVQCPVCQRYNFIDQTKCAGCGHCLRCAE